MPRVLSYSKAIMASPSGGQGEARLRRGVRPWHVRRGRSRHLGGPRLSARTLRSGGEPVPRLRRTTRWRAPVSSAAEAQNKRPQRGRLHGRGTGAVADGGRASEGCRGAWTWGNRVPPGPSRAKAARVDG